MNLAWAAGFFDGEGCICLARRFRKGKKHPEYELKLSVGQANPKPLELFSKSFGGNVNKRGDGYYICKLSSRDSIETLRILIPFLVLKKDEAIEALKFGGLMIGRRKYH